MDVTVYKRKTTKGESASYHYRFQLDYVRYTGVCENCGTKADAMSYARKVKKAQMELAAHKTDEAVIADYRQKLSGKAAILLKDAYELSIPKPRKRHPCETRIRFKRGYWQDFLTFMHDKFPDITTINQVLPPHAEAYIYHLRQYGRYDKTNTYHRGERKIEYESEFTRLSNNTCNEYLATLKEVFKVLAFDAGLSQNPFAAIERLAKDDESREPFSDREWVMIRDKADEFTRPLFIIAMLTAMREGDVCTLLWEEIDFEKEVIQRYRQCKTGYKVEIPMMPPLIMYLMELKEKHRNMVVERPYRKYVLPEHARMYSNNPSGVSERIKNFLESLGIKTTRKLPHRTRAVSIKDLHSCRHSFCFYAMMYNIPLSVIQQLVGHRTIEMTQKYCDHVTLEIKRQMMQRLPDFMKLTVIKFPQLSQCAQSTELEWERAEMIRLAKTLPLADVRNVLAACFRSGNSPLTLQSSLP